MAAGPIRAKTAARTLWRFRILVLAVRKTAFSYAAGQRVKTAAGTLLRFRILVPAVRKTAISMIAVRATTRTLWQPWGTRT